MLLAHRIGSVIDSGCCNGTARSSASLTRSACCLMYKFRSKWVWGDIRASAVAVTCTFCKPGTTSQELADLLTACR